MIFWSRVVQISFWYILIHFVGYCKGFGSYTRLVSAGTVDGRTLQPCLFCTSKPYPPARLVPGLNTSFKTYWSWLYRKPPQGRRRGGPWEQVLEYTLLKRDNSLISWASTFRWEDVGADSDGSHRSGAVQLNGVGGVPCCLQSYHSRADGS